MINYEKLVKRLGVLMNYYNLSASAFADKVGVQRSSISHLLSGRNRPSLEFVTKVVSTFPEVNLYWLLNGKGSFPSEDGAPPAQTSLPLTEKAPLPQPTVEKTNPSEPKTQTQKPKSAEKPLPIPIKKRVSTNKTIERIVIFYSDGSFEAYSEDRS